MKAFLVIAMVSLSTFACNEVDPQIKIRFVNLTGKTLNNIQTTKGAAGNLTPQGTSSEIKFKELKSMEDPQLEIKFTAEIDGQRFNQLPELRTFDPASYSQSPGNYLCEIRLSTSNNQIKGFFIKWIKEA